LFLQWSDRLANCAATAPRSLFNAASRSSVHNPHRLAKREVAGPANCEKIRSPEQNYPAAMPIYDEIKPDNAGVAGFIADGT
jgi:hypothetical protein